MIEFTPRAEQQFDDLRRHYEERGRLEALLNLADAVDLAMAMIENDPSGGLPAPRPYPFLAETGRAWVKAGRYWFAYSSTRHPPVITGIFYDAADIPNRT